MTPTAGHPAGDRQPLQSWFRDGDSAAGPAFGTAGSGGFSLRTVAVADIPAPDAAGNFFVHPAYLAACGLDNVLMLERPGEGPAFFAERHGHLVHLGRLATLAPSRIDALCDTLFAGTNVHSVVFEDVVAPQTPAPSRPHHRFGYQADWRTTAGPDVTHISSRRASTMRRKWKLLAKETGGHVEFHFEPCRPGDVAAIAELNRTKIEQAGGHHQLDAQKQAILEATAVKTGYTAKLTLDGRIIAGNIICTAGTNAFFNIMGYDLAFSKFSPGLQVHLAALKELGERGYRDIHLLWGDSSWKKDVGADRQPLTTLVVLRNRRVFLTPEHWAAFAPFLVQATRRRLKPVLERVLGEALISRLRHLLPSSH
ncbi:GNAT family N-acetyltransferase [Rhodobium gokarnense]|uniref:BioF2-like acetyltransferase domain-containing protein n=1 Tax=Rhodobium gokarnense TaxID=364296 RepID=A0ABT3H9X3_9HYPH|nr:GNAT family N-acetyltransferase [Rhodobium gokarnense]MCW2307195.1 hypothetical protein [Rhodobium gokarnense]